MGKHAGRGLPFAKWQVCHLFSYAAERTFGSLKPEEITS